MKPLEERIFEAIDRGDEVFEVAKDELEELYTMETDMDLFKCVNTDKGHRIRFSSITIKVKD